MSNWNLYRPSKSIPWDLSRVVHLHRRAAFAANWGEVQRDLNDGPQPALDRIINGRTRLQSSQTFETLSHNIANSAVASSNALRLKAWWLYRMLNSPDPLGERLTLMWHNHFATSNLKVDNLRWMLQQNEILRKNARAPFGQLLSATLKHPAMLKWLDANANRKGHPNENMGRELLELFTLGVGNYTEADVKSAAKALTGWAIIDGNFVFRQSRHHDEVIELFGEASKLDGDQLLEKTLMHPATSKRIAWRICKTLMGEGVNDQASIDELALGLQKNDLNVGWAIETVLRSERFFSSKNIRNRVAGPSEQVIGAVKATELLHPPPTTLRLAEWCIQMGQDLFYPPNVGGWKQGRHWLDSRSMIARMNYAHALTTGSVWRQERGKTAIESTLAKLAADYDIGSNLWAHLSWLSKLLLGTSEEAFLKPLLNDVQSSETPLVDTLGRILASSEYCLG